MKQKQVLFILVGAIVLMLGGQLSTPIQQTSLQQRIAEVQQQGFDIKTKDDTITVTNMRTGLTLRRTASTPSGDEVRRWGSERGIPIVEIDPARFDTSMNRRRFVHWARVAAGREYGEEFSVVGDVDGNGSPEVYGYYRLPNRWEPELRIYEVDLQGNSQLRYRFPGFPGVPWALTDINDDALIELVLGDFFGHQMKFFKQTKSYRLPTDSLFSFPFSETVGFTPAFGLLDSDQFMDCLFRDVATDSQSGSPVRMVTLAEYDSFTQRFVRRWSERVPLRGQAADVLGGFAAGDFDQDGRMEFATVAGLTGRFFVFESVADNSFQLTFQDSTPFVNYYSIASGDLDGDSRSEIFSTAIMADGNWTLVYTASANDAFKPSALLHFRAGGGIDIPSYLACDMDQNGLEDLIVAAAPYIMILQADPSGGYSLWYVQREINRRTIQVFDLNRDGRKDIIVGKSGLDSTGNPHYFSDLYLNNPVTGVGEGRGSRGDGFVLNYPNPFNSSTNISYNLEKSQPVRISIYDVKGAKVIDLVDRAQPAGFHSVTLNGFDLASGVYYCQLQTPSTMQARKLLLLR
jgi:hypothetical protein